MLVLDPTGNRLGTYFGLSDLVVWTVLPLPNDPLDPPGLYDFETELLEPELLDPLGL